MAVVLKRRLFTLDEYHRMGEAGILGEEDRVELIEGEIVEMTPVGPRHAATVKRINNRLKSRLGDRVIVSVQDPVQLPAQISELQPDVVLLRPRADFYASAHPGPADILLIIEVSDTSIDRDRAKLSVYVRAGVPETWLANLETDRLEVYRRPTPDGYRDTRVLGRGEPITIEAFPDVALTVDDLLG